MHRPLPAAEDHRDVPQFHRRFSGGRRVGLLRPPLAGLAGLGHLGDGEPRYGGQQPLGVVVRGAQQYVLDGSGLHDGALVHHRDPVGEVRDDAHVVGDQQDTRAGLGREPPQQVEDLGLHGHVERGGGFVGDQQRRFVGDGHGDDDPLALAAGELERIGAGPLLGLGDADAAQQFDGARGGVGRGRPPVVADHLGDLLADPGERVERGGRLLEDHRDGRSAQPGQPLLVGADDVGAVHDGPPGGAGVAGQQPHGRQRDGGLARARLADQGERLAGRYVQGHAPHGLHRAGLRGEDDAQVVEVEDVVPGGGSGRSSNGAHARPLTSNASRSPSPIALNAHTTRMMARPGGTISHQ
ncbi:hypothetical protein SVIOM342S_03321 [Streptomyces violaceorubidus]